MSGVCSLPSARVPGDGLNTGTNDPSLTAGRETSRSKLLWLYYCLAAFDILTVSTVLYMGHQSLTAYNESLAQIHTWDQREQDCSELARLAALVNAPGNNLFQTADVVAERERMQSARQTFNVALEQIAADLRSSVPSADAGALTGELNDVRASMAAMIAEAEPLFALFAAGEVEQAGRRMAAMDRRLEQIQTHLREFARRVSANKQDLLRRYQQRASGTETAEYIVASLILVMIVCATRYGHRIAQQMDADARERQQASEAIAAARNQAVKASHAKSEFLANMSHEIRTPMNGILGMLQLTLRTSLNQRQREFLTMANASAETLLRLLNDILDFSKIEAGRLELEAIQFDLREQLGKTLKIMAPAAQAKGLELTLIVAPEVPDQLVGDPGRLNQVIVNLIGNATKFTSQGEIIVRVDVEDARADSVQLHFSVRDTGVGIPADKQRQIFNAFTQADGSTTREYGGTGLGLAICSHLTHAMGGRIWVESQPGAGSTFHVAARFAPRTKPIPTDTRKTRSRNWAGTRVLIVDDNATNRRLLCEMLEHWGLAPTAVADGPAALEEWRASCRRNAPYPLVLLDALMPDMDGFQVAEQLRHDAHLSGTTIMMLSSLDLHDESERCRDLGISVLLRKPITESELLESILEATGFSELALTPDAVSELPASRQLRVLVADDTLVNQRLAFEILTDRGHVVTVANDGREALELLDGHYFDVVLMDVQMPRLDGLQATAQIRQREAGSGQHLPIIAMTAHALKGDIERCLRNGMDAYLPKPLSPSELIRLVESQPSGQPGDGDADTAQPAVFDLESALMRACGKPGLLCELIELSLTDLSIQLDQAECAVESGNCRQLEQAAHRIKGTTVNIGGDRLADAAQRLEHAAQHAESSDLRSAFAELKREMQQLVPQLREYLQESLTSAR